MTASALPVGKLPHGLLDELLSGAPALPPEVLLGPRIGEDGCAIAVDSGVLVAATDPITMTGTGVGAHAVAINANDVAVMGVAPRWFLASVLLAPGTTEAEVRQLFAGMIAALSRVGAALVGGHTEVTDAVRQTVVVGQMLGFAPTGGVVKTGGLRPGDRLVQVGPAPVEGAAVLAEMYRERLGAVDPGLRQQAASAIESPGISVVEPALAATRLGACAMHDPTEGGLSAGLHEMAGASGVGLRINPDAVLWFEPGLALCSALGADPWGTLASGTLLAGFPAERVDSALRALRERGWAVAEIGQAYGGDGQHDVRFDSGGALARYERDELSRLGALLPASG